MKKKENNQYYREMSDTYIGQIAGYFVKLLNMKEGDIVSIPVNGKIHLFTVSGKYKYRKDLKVEKIAHAVPIDTSSEVIVNLEELDFLNSTPTFKRAVQNRSTIISLDPYAEQINSLIE
ncbi:hypothetical protein [Fructobacillus tropaeoli]|uniref:Uncharacterized protein n=1 Tax=Fructobacillus tropaeoli TaxID=709323 RepID=A0A3F3HHS6_9LACO|nr:hypothetical protein [Fructobacillus tropaeoli]GAP04803.1 hypothetical protein FTRO_0090040 [Fructobacillus tropaeoli]